MCHQKTVRCFCVWNAWWPLNTSHCELAIENAISHCKVRPGHHLRAHSFLPLSSVLAYQRLRNWHSSLFRLLRPFGPLFAFPCSFCHWCNVSRYNYKSQQGHCRWVAALTAHCRMELD